MALKEKVAIFERALNRLKEAYTEAINNRGNRYFPFFRDSTLQRFEFTVETLWKGVKAFLLEVEGVECRSPKGCMRELFSAGYLNEDETTKLLYMINDRNLTSHTYREEIADEIFSRIGNYIQLMEKVLKVLKSGADEKGA